MLSGCFFSTNELPDRRLLSLWLFCRPFSAPVLLLLLPSRANNLFQCDGPGGAQVRPGHANDFGEASMEERQLPAGISSDGWECAIDGGCHSPSHDLSFGPDRDSDLGPRLGPDPCHCHCRPDPGHDRDPAARDPAPSLSFVFFPLLFLRPAFWLFHGICRFRE